MSQPSFKPYHAPAGGWGSAFSVANILIRQKIPLSGAALLLKQNKPISGFACVSCAWAKPYPPRPLSFCENGAKATAWENTSHRCGPDFFAAHRVSELLNWTDFDLERQGRLTHPMRYDSATDHYKVVSWGWRQHRRGLRRHHRRPHPGFHRNGRQFRPRSAGHLAD